MKFVRRFHHCLNVRKQSSEKIVCHTLKWPWKMNVFRLHLKVSKSISLLREIGREFQSRGAQVEKALPPNDLSLKDCSERRCFDWIELQYLGYNNIFGILQIAVASPGFWKGIVFPKILDFHDRFQRFSKKGAHLPTLTTPMQVPSRVQTWNRQGLIAFYVGHWSRC
jgi:hypothetical protein